MDNSIVVYILLIMQMNSAVKYFRRVFLFSKIITNEKDRRNWKLLNRTFPTVYRIYPKNAWCHKYTTALRTFLTHQYNYDIPRVNITYVYDVRRMSCMYMTVQQTDDVTKIAKKSAFLCRSNISSFILN